MGEEIDIEKSLSDPVSFLLNIVANKWRCLKVAAVWCYSQIRDKIDLSNVSNESHLIAGILLATA